jgi:uncharacterized protein (DUF58 family)
VTPEASRSAIPPEVLAHIRQIEIQTRRLVNDLFLGQYHAVFRGRGIEFSEVREYQYGDDQRAIDWNVTARMGVPYVKKFQEERELTVVLAADVSASSSFGTAGRSKAALAAEAGALLALSAVRNNDRVGLLTFTDRVETYLEPRKGPQHVLRVIRELLYPEPAGTGTDIGLAAELLARVLKRRSLVFVLSDFASEGFETQLSYTARKHDVVGLTLTDPREEQLPAVGIVELQDLETGERVLVDTGDERVRRGYHEEALRRREARSRGLRSLGIEEVPLRTDTGIVEPLMAFFRARARRN